MRRARLGGGAVVAANGESVVCHVQDQIFTHNGKTDEADVSLGFASLASFLDHS